MALPAPPKEEPEVDLNATGDNVVPNGNSILEIAIERVASREQSRPQSKAWISVPSEPARPRDSTVDLVRTNGPENHDKRKCHVCKRSASEQLPLPHF